MRLESGKIYYIAGVNAIVFRVDGPDYCIVVDHYLDENASIEGWGRRYLSETYHSSESIMLTSEEATGELLDLYLRFETVLYDNNVED